MKKQWSLIAATLLGTSVLSGCGGESAVHSYPLVDRGEIAYTFAETDTYKNFIEFEGEWTENPWIPEDAKSGTGDPFILRYNGRYYLYSSSSDKGGYPSDKYSGGVGIRCHVSDDMINWQPCGYYDDLYCCVEETSYTAWAPEVIYYKGRFYLVQSSCGLGHSIYVSDEPTGPFRLVSRERLDGRIDGSFTVSDDGQLYLLSAGKTSSIESSMLTVGADEVTKGVTNDIAGVSANGWTEGPGVFRRGDYYYMTYTGNNVASPTYRVAYSYSDSGSPVGGYRTSPYRNVIVDTEGEAGYYGPGHSSNAYGPDLDSVWTAYHTLYAVAGPQRRYNVDRYTTNGSSLLVNGPTDYAVSVPKRADFEAYADREEDLAAFDKTQSAGVTTLMSKDAAEDVYTAELHFKRNASSASVVFSRKDTDNYFRLSFEGARMKLYRVNGGLETEISSANVGGFVREEGMISVRVEAGYAKTYIYLDSMRKIVLNYGIGGGKIGYMYDGEAQPSFTAFSNDCFGTSDFEAVKNLPTKFSAVHYLKGENRGFSLANARVSVNGVRQGEKENTKTYDTGETSLILDSAGDWVKYAVHASEEGFYNLSAALTPASAGAVFEIVVDGRESYLYRIPPFGVNEGSGFGNLSVASLPLTAGNHTLKLRLIEGSMEATTFELYRSNPTRLDYTYAMDEIAEKGWDYLGNWKIKNGALSSGKSDLMYAFGGDDRFSDFVVEVEFSINEEETVYEGGLLLRGKNINQDNIWQTPQESLQGYYLAIRNDQIVLYRCDFEKVYLNMENISAEKGKFYKLKVELAGNRISVYFDGEKLFESIDDHAWPYGKVGLICEKIDMSFKNFRLVTR